MGVDFRGNGGGRSPNYLEHVQLSPLTKTVRKQRTFILKKNTCLGALLHYILLYRLLFVFLYIKTFRYMFDAQNLN